MLNTNPVKKLPTQHFSFHNIEVCFLFVFWKSFYKYVAHQNFSADSCKLWTTCPPDYRMKYVVVTFLNKSYGVRMFVLIWHLYGRCLVEAQLKISPCNITSEQLRANTALIWPTEERNSLIICLTAKCSPIEAWERWNVMPPDVCSMKTWFKCLSILVAV